MSPFSQKDNGRSVTPVGVSLNQKFRSLGTFFESHLYLHVTIILGLYFILRQVCYKQLLLGRTSYFQPIILLDALRYPVFTSILLIAVLLLLLNYGKFTWNRFYGNWRWEDSETFGRSRYFIFFIALIIAWAFSTYDFNFYYNQAHYIDRLLLILSCLLILVNPIFTLAFVAVSITITSQFEYPAVFLYSWTDKRVLYDLLILFSIYLGLKLVFSVRFPVFLLLAICLIASHYFIPGLTKLQQGVYPTDWIFQNRLHYLFVSCNLNGWLGSLDTQTVLRIADMLKMVEIPVQVFTIVVEVGAIFILTKKRITIAILAGAGLLHFGIYLSSGIFFWKWMLLDLGLIIFLWKNRNVQWVNSIYQARYTTLSIGIIAFSSSYFFVPRLGWFDTPVSNFYELEAVDINGNKYNIERGFLSPYDIVFVQSRFYFLSDENLLFNAFGTVSWDYPLVQTLYQTNNPSDIFNIQIRDGRNYYDSQLADQFDEFIRTYFHNLNQRMDKTVLPSFLQPPHHLNTTSREPLYRLQAPIRAIQIRFVQTYYDDATLHVLADKVIREIEIPQ